MMELLPDVGLVDDRSQVTISMENELYTLDLKPELLHRELSNDRLCSDESVKMTTLGNMQDQLCCIESQSLTNRLAAETEMNISTISSDIHSLGADGINQSNKSVGVLQRSLSASSLSLHPNIARPPCSELDKSNNKDNSNICDSNMREIAPTSQSNRVLETKVRREDDPRWDYVQFIQDFESPRIKKVHLTPDKKQESDDGDIEDGSATKRPTENGGVELEVHEPRRGVWATRFDFILSCLGYSVGLGNIWRFPYLVYKNGGGAYMVPYVFFLMTIGLPLVYLEMCLGQYTSQGPVGVWNIAPLFGGVGVAMAGISILVSIYYNVLMSWILFYLFASMQTTLPWISCNNDWNTDACCENRLQTDNCSVYIPEIPDNTSCMVCLRYANNTRQVALVANDSFGNLSASVLVHNSSVISPTEEYFHNYVLELLPSFTGLGNMRWQLLLCLMLAWTLTFLCLIRSVRSSGKVVYVAVLLPYAILLGLLIRTAFLPGAKQGAIFYLKPDWARLADPNVWRDAANQVLFSIGPCYGGLVTLASYNKFTNNFNRDALTVVMLNALTSVFAGFVIFTTLGHMSWKLGLPIDSIVSSDFSLAFIVYPEAMSASGPAIAVLFFLTLTLLGVDSQFVLVHTVVVTLLDCFPRRLLRHKIWVLLGVCAALCALGMPLTTQAGLYLVEILDTYATDWSVLLVGVSECVVIVWVCGFTRLQGVVWVMLGKRPGLWLRFMWSFFTPAFLLVLLAYSIAVHAPIQYERNLLPFGASVASWAVAGFAFLLLPAYAVYALIITRGPCSRRMRRVLRPPRSWGPIRGAAELLSMQRTLPDYMVSDQEPPDVPRGPINRQMSLYSETGSTISTASSISREHGLAPQEGVQCGELLDTGTVAWSCDENKQRGNWTGRMDFLFSCLGYCIGIGNVWRFPYLVYKNGGGAFFLPYLLMLFLCGLPLCFMEFAFGQFASVGAVSVWKVSPIFKGVGYAMMMATAMVTVYYNVINSWSVYYLFASMTHTLPWTSCNNSWNTDTCKILGTYNLSDSCVGANLSAAVTTTLTTLLDNVTSPNTTFSQDPILPNFPKPTSAWDDSKECVTRETLSTPSEEYFRRHVMELTSGIDDVGCVRWHLALCLLLCWCITFVALIRGVKSAGKVAYVTVSFPFFILLVLFIRYATIDTEAYLNGIKYYVTPDWSRLTDATVWGDAASQLFFSLGLCHGGLIGLSSYNRFHYDCLRDTYIVCLLDTFTSVFAGFVIFSILGVMAKEAGTDVGNVVQSSFTLAYVAYPEAVLRLPLAPLWSALFFMMLFSLAIDSHYFMVESIVIAIMDEFPQRIWRSRLVLVGVLCVVFFLLGLPLVTQGGLYIVVLMDKFVAAWTPLVVGILMCLALSWVYKTDNFCNNITAMLGGNVRWWWRVIWKAITPLLLTFILVFSWVMYTPPMMDDYLYPEWAHGMGLLLSLLPVLCIPTYVIITLIRNRHDCRQGLLKACKPVPDWGPALYKHQLIAYIPGVVAPADSLTRTAEWVAKEAVPEFFLEKEVAMDICDVEGNAQGSTPEEGSSLNSAGGGDGEFWGPPATSPAKDISVSTADYLGSDSDSGILVMKRPKHSAPMRDAATQTTHSRQIPGRVNEGYDEDEEENNACPIHAITRNGPVRTSTPVVKGLKSRSSTSSLRKGSQKIPQTTAAREYQDGVGVRKRLSFSSQTQTFGERGSSMRAATVTRPFTGTGDGILKHSGFLTHNNSKSSPLIGVNMKSIDHPTQTHVIPSIPIVESDAESANAIIEVSNAELNLSHNNNCAFQSDTCTVGQEMELRVCDSDECLASNICERPFRRESATSTNEQPPHSKHHMVYSENEHLFSINHNTSEHLISASQHSPSECFTIDIRHNITPTSSQHNTCLPDSYSEELNSTPLHERVSTPTSQDLNSVPRHDRTSPSLPEHDPCNGGSTQNAFILTTSL